MDPFSTVWKMDSLLPTNFPALSLVCTRASASFFFSSLFLSFFPFFFAPLSSFFFHLFLTNFEHVGGHSTGKKLKSDAMEPQNVCLASFRSAEREFGN